MAETVKAQKRGFVKINLPIPSDLENEIEEDDIFETVVDRKNNRVTYILKNKKLKSVNELLGSKINEN